MREPAFVVVYNDYACNGAPWRIHENGLDIGGFIYKHNADQTAGMMNKQKESNR